jgi:hypothetical protein
MNQIRIDEIVESLERIVEYTGEETHIDPMPYAECDKFLWTALRDLARCVRDIAPTPEDILLDFEGEESTIDLILQWALAPGTQLKQVQLDAMRRLAKEILFLRATCRSAGLDMKSIERQTREMISRSEVAERRKTCG